MKLKFIFFIAFRYFNAKKKSKSIATSMLLIISIAIGIMALTVVIGIMNGFQLSFIEPILNVNSYHIQISGGPLSLQQQEKILAIKEVTALVPFAEYQGLIEGENAVLIRALPADILNKDPSFAGSFQQYSSRTMSFYDTPNHELLSLPGGIVLGNVLLKDFLLLGKGDHISIFSATDHPVMELEITGAFMTGYFDIDAGWGFISLETAALFHAKPEDIKLQYGVKLVNYNQDNRAVEKIRRVLGDDFKIQSWRVFNSTFFRTLRMEKILMSLLIGLIFIIVAFGIYNSLHKTVQEKIEEIALLKALGTSASAIKYIFIVEGFLIGISGGLLGTILGLFVAFNVNEIFRFTEYITNNYILPLIEKFLAPFFQHLRFAPIAILSPNIYYMDKVPVRVLLNEAVIANLFAVVFSVAAAYFASHKIAEYKPASVLRYE